MHERSTLNTNGTDGAFFEGLDYRRYLLLSGVGITLLFTLLAPSASEGYGLLGRLGFWTTHTYGALAALVVAQGVLGRLLFFRQRPFLGVAVAGILGVLLFTPLAFAFESLFDQPMDSDEDGLEIWAAEFGMMGSLLVEALEMSPSLMVTWLLLNLPWLRRLGEPQASEEMPPASEEVQTVTRTNFLRASTPEAVEIEAESAVEDPMPEAEEPEVFDTLPGALGSDIVSSPRSFITSKSTPHAAAAWCSTTSGTR